MAAPEHVLIYGRDATLLHTRKLLLLQGGFLVWTTEHADEVEKISKEHEIDLLILCHTLTDAQCKDAVEAARVSRPALALTVGYAERKSAPESYTFNILEGPRALLKGVIRMLASVSSRASSNTTPS